MPSTTSNQFRDRQSWIDIIITKVSTFLFLVAGGLPYTSKKKTLFLLGRLHTSKRLVEDRSPCGALPVFSGP